MMKVRIGIPWSVQMFVKEARQFTHPFDEQVKLPPAIARVIYNQATLGPSEIRRKRLAVLEHYKKRVGDLAPEERANG